MVEKLEKQKIFVSVYPDEGGKIHVTWDIKGKPTPNQLAAMIFMLELGIDKMKKTFCANGAFDIEDEDL